MGDDQRRGGSDENVGPGATYKIFDIMSDLLDKLKLLNFEQNFIDVNGMKPIPKHYFAMPTNPGEQFYTFTSLCAWLINVTGKSFDMPQEFDDPNATISRILDKARSFGTNTDFPPNKLKSGSGPHVCMLLDKFAENALKSTKFSWEKPLYESEDEEDDEVVHQEDDAELKLEKIEDDLAAADDSDDDADVFLDLNSTAKAGKEVSKENQIMLSNTSSEQWRLEIERVTPSLKVTVRSDNKDWRAHVEQMNTHKVGIETTFAQSKQQLGKMQAEIQKTLEKISSREKYINGQLENLVQDYRNVQERFAQSKEKYKQGSSGVTERSRSLAEVSEELEKVKIEMEEKGSSMTDGAPLVKIKQTLGKLKTETTQMDIRIGVIEHVLRQAHFKDKTFGISTGGIKQNVY